MPDTTYSSFWLFRQAKENWSGTKDPIANKTNFITTNRGKVFSKFNATVAENIINYWSEEGDTILDPFAGRTRAFVSSMKNRKYYGFEISKEVHDIIQPLIEEHVVNDTPEYPPIIYNEDSYHQNLFLPREVQKNVDMVFSCPPYGNIEKYESCEGQLSDLDDYNEFLERYGGILKKSCENLRPAGFCALVVGDYRVGDTLIPFHSDTIKILQEIGMIVHDIIAIQSVTFNVACHRFKSASTNRITAKAHEYLLVFRKPGGEVKPWIKKKKTNQSVKISKKVKKKKPILKKQRKKTESQITKRVCSICEKEFVTDKFHKQQTTCSIECRKIRKQQTSRKFRIENRDRLTQYQRDFRKKKRS